MAQMDDFLTPYEVEHLVQQIKEIPIEQYGSTEWFRQHETLDRLNIQAHKNAMNSSDEYVMDSFVTFDKMKVVIYDLLCTEVWKEKLHPLLMKQMTQINSVRSYMTVYHEVSTLNFLEVLLFHRSACEAADDTLVELIDYCYRKFSKMVRMLESLPDGQFLQPDEKAKSATQFLNQSKEKDLTDQIEEIDFKSSMTCFSLIRFITDHIEALPLPIIHQMMENNDVPCVLVPLLEFKPWIRTNAKGEQEKFEDQKWTVIQPHERGKLTKIEAQVWLTIYNMFMTNDSSRKYEMTSFRKQNLLRLRKYMNEVLLDQLPMLNDMLRGLEELNMRGDPGAVSTSNAFIVQTLPEIRTRLLAKKNWREIADQQAKTFFKKGSAQEKADMNRLVELYASDVFEDFMDDPKCEECGALATQRCSRCKMAWYCSRDCQLRQWKKHKAICAMFQESKEEAKANSDQNNSAAANQANTGKKKRPLIQEL